MHRHRVLELTVYRKLLQSNINYSLGGDTSEELRYGMVSVEVVGVPVLSRFLKISFAVVVERR